MVKLVTTKAVKLNIAGIEVYTEVKKVRKAQKATLAGIKAKTWWYTPTQPVKLKDAEMSDTCDKGKTHQFKVACDPNDALRSRTVALRKGTTNPWSYWKAKINEPL